MADNSFLEIVIKFLPLIIAVVIHEVAHGYVADKLGDNTARKLGRITLNPLKHIDPFMTIILPGMLILSGSPVIFGGAKPVPVNILNFRNPKRDMAIVAAAGPASNFILAAIGIGLLYGNKIIFGPGISLWVLFLVQWVLINVVLAVFNLFPLPPLDGGRITVGLLPDKLAASFAKIEKYGFLILVLLLYSGVINRYLTPIIEHLINFMEFIIS